MKPKSSTIANLTATRFPDVYREICNLCEPLLANTNHIPAIHSEMKRLYPDLDRTDESILFAASVYSAFAPATLLGKFIERAPNGIRQEMCNVMEWKDAPIVNFYADKSRSYIKGSAGVEFNKKISAILLGFEKFSVKTNQLSLL